MRTKPEVEPRLTTRPQPSRRIAGAVFCASSHGALRLAATMASHTAGCDTSSGVSAAANDLPLEFFVRLIWQESRFDPSAVSQMGAQGIAQFMPATAAMRRRLPGLWPLRSVRDWRARPDWELLDLASDLLLGDADVVGALEVQPELCRGAEPVAEAQSGVAGDASPAVNDLRDAIRRNLDLAGKLGRRHADLLQLVGEDFAGMNGRWTVSLGL